MLMEPEDNDVGELNLAVEEEEYDLGEKEEELQQMQEEGIPIVATHSVIVTLGGKREVALVDSGSSHTFVDLKFATSAQCVTQNNSLQSINVAGGGIPYTGAHI